MQYRIHYDGRYQDSLVIQADTIEEIREKAHAQCAHRGWNEDDCWSERLDG